MSTAAGGGALDARQASPLVSRLLVGLRLRRLREKRGLSSEAAGQAIGAPVSEISLLETGQAGFRMRDLVGLCTLYGVTDQTERATLLGLARRANHSEWWHPYRDMIPGWFERYLGLEQAASLIRGYEAQFIHGLLQTPGYARAAITLGHGGIPVRDIDGLVELRMSRQQVLRRPRPLRLWVVIDEAALRRPVGGRRAMRAQLQHLLGICDLPQLTIQVLPFRAGGHPAVAGTIAVLRLPDPQLPDVVYLEQATTADYSDAPGQLYYYRHIMNQLAIQADPADCARDSLSQILHDT